MKMSIVDILQNKSVPSLIDILRNKDTVWKEREAAIEALSSLGDIQAVEPLIAILENKSEDSTIREAATEVLGNLGDLQAYDLLVSILQSDDEEMFLRSRVAEALGKLGDVRAIPMLIEILKNPGEIVWSFAKTALKKFDTIEAQQALASYNPPKFLRIDDTPRSVDVIEDILERSGYEVITVNSAQKGFQKAVDIQPEAILVDIPLPDSSSYEFARKFKNNEATASIPMLALSAHPFNEDEKRIYDECLSKPLDIFKFLEQVTKYLRKKV